MGLDWFDNKKIAACGVIVRRCVATQQLMLISALLVILMVCMSMSIEFETSERTRFKRWDEYRIERKELSQTKNTGIC